MKDYSPPSPSIFFFALTLYSSVTPILILSALYKIVIMCCRCWFNFFSHCPFVYVLSSKEKKNRTQIKHVCYLYMGFTVVWAANKRARGVTRLIISEESVASAGLRGALRNGRKGRGAPGPAAASLHTFRAKIPHLERAFLGFGCGFRGLPGPPLWLRRNI